MPTPISGVVIVSALIGAVQVSKHAGLPSRYGGVLAVILGVAAALASQTPSLSNPSMVFSVVLTGIVWGLMASGLYSGTSALQSIRMNQQAGATTTSATPASPSNIGALPTDLKPMPAPKTPSSAVFPPVEM
jgi:hypothetical protein